MDGAAPPDDELAAGSGMDDSEVTGQVAEDPSLDEITEVASPDGRRKRDSFAPVGSSDHLDRGAARTPNSSEHSGVVSEHARTSVRKRQSRVSSLLTGHSTHDPLSPLGALHEDEVERMRQFIFVAYLIELAGSACLLFLDGNATLRSVFLVAILIAVAATAYLSHALVDAANYTMSRVLPVAGTVALAVIVGVYFLGPFSPATTVLLLGIYFFSFGESLLSTYFMYLLCAIGQGGLASLVMFGAIPDVSVVSAASLSLPEQIAIQLFVQVLYFGAFYTARQNRKTALAALSRLQQASLDVAQRDAQLREARHDLERALKLGGPGRYTDVEIGSFVIAELLGRGGMGEVYRASNVKSGDDAAVKLLHPRALANPDQLKRFLREIEVIDQLDSPYIVQVKEWGASDDGTPYLAMELLRGRDLSSYLRKRRRMSIESVITLISHIGSGLETAREAGVVHRDIKPQNLFRARVSGEAVWKILDFGVSKLAESSGTLTQGHVVGTPGYMSPEQARGEDVDYRADVYSLAIIAYRCLTGHPAFAGKDVPSTMYDVVYKMPFRPSLLAELHADVDLALAIGVAKRPGDRFDSGQELADALRDAAIGQLPATLRARAYDLLEEMPWRGPGAEPNPPAG